MAVKIRTNKEDVKKRFAAQQGSHHDIFFKFCYGDAELAKELFGMAFSEEEWDAFDWSGLRPEKDSLGNLRADLVFSVPFKENPQRRARLCIILEHKSRFSPRVYYQMLRYETSMVGKSLEEPELWGPVIAVLLYNGKEPWRWPKSLKEGLWGDILQKMPSSLVKDVIDLGIRVLDVNSPLAQKAIKNKRFKSRGGLAALRDIWSLREGKGNLRERLKKTLSLFDNWPRDREELALHLGHFFWSAISGMTREIWEDIEQDSVNKGIFIKGGFMDIREQWLKEGQVEGMKAVALNMLKESLDVPLICKMTGFSEEEIENLKNEN